MIQMVIEFWAGLAIGLLAGFLLFRFAQKGDRE